MGSGRCELRSYVESLGSLERILPVYEQIARYVGNMGKNDLVC